MNKNIHKSSIINHKSLSLTIGWLYPDLMSTYGDRGNIIVLQKRCEWRGINVKIEHITVGPSHYSLVPIDLLFMGGAQDTQQEIVSRDLLGAKGKTLVSMINKGIPGLYICGAYQFLGKYYRTASNKKLPGLGVFSLRTESAGKKTKRLIGNIIVQPKAESQILNTTIVGFENHGGRTYLDDKSLALGKVIKGFGNNGEDKTEGIIYKNSIGTYLHGPILPKNPGLADWLISRALEVKYGKKIKLESLDDYLEKKAKDVIVNKIIS